MSPVIKDIIGFAFLAIPSLIVITNPILATSFFISLTASAPEELQKRIARRTSIASFLILLSFAAFGTLIFRVFSITIEAFQIAGGIILFTVALGMLQAKEARMRQTPEEMQEALAKTDVAIVPLAIPMVSGPGAITTAIVLAGEAREQHHMLILFIAIVVACLLIYICLRNAERIQRRMGKTAINVMNRLMGLILAAIAAQFVINGVESILPDLIKAASGTPS